MEKVMEITIKPTARIREVDGVEHREWEGVDDEGVHVIALVRAVAPMTHSEAVAGRYRQALKDIGFAVLSPIDLNKVL